MDLLPQKKTLQLLRKYRIPYAKTMLFKDRSDLRTNHITYPVVLKLLSEKIIHKSDAGAVITGIKNKTGLIQEALRAESNIQKTYGKIKLDYMVQKQEQGREVIIGMKRDAQFGPVILFGLGGIFVEVFKDVSMRVAPLASCDILQMLDIKASRILKGYRGEKPVDQKGLADILHKISSLSLHEKDILEIDFNPVIVNERYAKVVDARMLR